MMDYDNTTKEERAVLYGCNGLCYGSEKEGIGVCSSIDMCPATREREQIASVMVVLALLVMSIALLLMLGFLIIFIIKILF